MMMPMLFPTVVIGVGKDLAEFIKSVQSLLHTYVPEVLPIVQVGIVTDEGQLTDAHGSPVLPGKVASAGASVQEETEVAKSISASLAYCLEDVVTEDQLESVRGAGITVGLPEGALFVRVVLVLDGSSSPELLSKVLTELKAAAETVRQPLPVRLTCVALTAGSEKAELGFPLHDWLQGCRSERLEPVNVVMLDRFRFDGSSLGKEEVRWVLPFLLFAALLPTETPEHWFFASPARSAPPHTFGFGAMVVPLPEIELALSHELMADLLNLMPAEPDPSAKPNRFLQPFQLTEGFDERTVWKSLFSGLPVDLNLTDANPFAVQLHQGQVKLELDEVPWQQWAERIANYDAKWGKVLAEEWIKQMRERAKEQTGRLRERIVQVLDAAVREGKGFFRLAEEGLKQIRGILREKWRCEEPGVKVGVPDPNLTAGRQELESALQQMPNGWAVAARCFLLILVQAYAAFALARCVWMQEPAYAVIPALAGLALVGFTGWHGASLWHDAYQRVLNARNAYIAAIAQKYETVLAGEGILTLREMRKRLLSELEAKEEQLTKLRERVTNAIKEAHTAAQQFNPRHSPLIRPVVDDWKDLEPVAHDLWGGKELKPLLQEMMRRSGLTSFEGLWQAAEPQPSPVQVQEMTETEEPEAARPALSPLVMRFVEPALSVLRENLSGEQLRTLTYYLRRRFPADDEREQWVGQQVRNLYAQAIRMLWTELGGSRRTRQLLPLGEDSICDIAIKHHPEQVQPGERLFVPGVLGTLTEQEVTPPPTRNVEC